MTVTATLALRYILLAGFVGILALCIWLFVRRPNRQLYVIPLATWAVNGTLFYGALVLGILPGGEVTVLLSAALRLHSVTTILGGLIIFIWRPKQSDDGF